MWSYVIYHKSHKSFMDFGEKQISWVIMCVKYVVHIVQVNDELARPIFSPSHLSPWMTHFPLLHKSEILVLQFILVPTLSMLPSYSSLFPFFFVNLP